MHAVLKPGPSRKKPPASSAARLARAVSALRQGKPVTIRGGARFSLLAVETASVTDWAKLRRRGAYLLLTHARARTLKIRLYTPGIVALPVAQDARLGDLRAIADPAADLDHPLKGPFRPLRETLPAAYASAIKLAKLAGLLPAVVVLPRWHPRNAALVEAKDIDGADDEAVRSLSIVARARVPLAGAERTELVAFRSADGGPEHYAVVIGTPPTGRPVLTRMHSACFTGDFLGSLKCDCGSQLRGAIAAIEKARGGILLYLAQEGRGIGLINKLRAYRLQDQGFDTIEANERLGFEPDERRYAIAARMLGLLGYSAVRLMTNNPHKVAALEAEGVKVAARVRHAFPSTPHNRAYLKTKAKKSGHLF